MKPDWKLYFCSLFKLIFFTGLLFSGCSNVANNPSDPVNPDFLLTQIINCALDNCSTTSSVDNGLLMGGQILKTLNLAGTSSTPYGQVGVQGSNDGSYNTSQFKEAYGITTDGSSLYITDSSNYTIRKIDIASGTVSTFAGMVGSSGTTDATGTAAQFQYPLGITTDGTNLYLMDLNAHSVRKIVIATQVVTTYANTTGVQGNTDGARLSAQFRFPYGITTDNTNLFIADTDNHTIRKIDTASGTVSVFAGQAGLSGSTDATGPLARFKNPRGITTDGTNLFVVDAINYTIRQIVIATGVVTTLAGQAGVQGTTDGTGTGAQFFQPIWITCDGSNLYISESTSKHTIRKIVIATGVVTTLAGLSGTSGSTNGTGSAALFNNPAGITTDGNHLYIIDTYNRTIRKLE